MVIKKISILPKAFKNITKFGVFVWKYVYHLATLHTYM
jgi:hypothetical protein